MPIQSETELYAPVKHFFEVLGYTVKGEVLNCDLVAMRGDEEPVLVELKKTFNLPLVIQGMERLQRSERVYLAVEQNRNGKAPYGLRWSELVKLCRKLGLGLLVVRFYKTKAPVVEALCDPEPYAPSRSSKRAVKTIRLVHEFKERSGDYNVGGSSKVKLVTAYREKALLCALCLNELGGSGTSRAVRERTGYAKAASLMHTNHYRWFQHVDTGQYALTPLGVEALELYRHVLQGLPTVPPLAPVPEPVQVPANLDNGETNSDDADLRLPKTGKKGKKPSIKKTPSSRRKN
ncbi:DUF2161 family putative PD-(D/E)XK-type phosphodiesterase [Gorillibacterium timonense]|uniref:DUF2161 family putative PD-(D/E)XK-type phosphodiesterase n=1 Tax=Gorillibacterium timonense TaxID=1689269 RepID=UPI0009E691EB|nr:DUF2161 family putative PD-(D/E)XK-type phosphodiesterase [Gorillibacterium timonense]